MPPESMRRFVLWGSAGHAKVVADLLARTGAVVVALFDNDPAAIPALPGVSLYTGIDGFRQWCSENPDRGEISGLVAIGGHRGRDRAGIQDMFREAGLLLPSVVHPHASVGAGALLGAGTQVLARSVIGPDVRIGEACIVNHSAVVDHECVLGNGVHIAPGATLAGCIIVGDNVLVGAGATVLPRVRIGADSLIGAGAVVTRDVPAGVVVCGTPARVV